MTKYVYIVLTILTLLANTSFADQSTQYIIWQQQPISISLPLKQVKTLQFANPVTVGLPKSLTNKLTISNQAGLVMLHSLKSFSVTRVEVKDTVTKSVIILQLSTKMNASTTQLAILYQKPQVTNTINWLKPPNELQGELAYVTLTRYAELALYAPKRLRNNPYGIQLVQSYVSNNNGVNSKNIFHNLFYDASTVNIPWASWHGGNYYVTAVVVRNVLSVPLNLTHNLTLLCGHDNGIWKAVTFFPNWHLSKAGSKQDSTVAFLISSLPFSEAQKSCEVSHD